MGLSGIPYFDEHILKGGFPEGSLVLVAGEPGAGKTLFGATYLYNGAKKFGEKGMYVSFAETKEEFLEEMRAFGMDFGELEEGGLFRFIDLVTLTGEALEKEIDVIVGELSSFGPKRVVIDPISVFSQNLGPQKTRVFLHTLLGRFVKSTRATALLIAEKPKGEEKIGHGLEEFVADGVLILRYEHARESVKRVLEIPKMRRRVIKKAQHEYAITERGIEFIEVPQMEHGHGPSTGEKITTGIPQLNKMLDGGVYRGSNVLFVGMTGTGKTSFALHFVVSNALQGKKAVYISFEEPVNQVIRTARNYGLEIDDALSNDHLKVLSWVPEAETPVYTFFKIRNIIEEIKPEVLAIDGLTALRQHLDPEELEKMLRYLSIFTKGRGITVYYTLTENTSFEVTPFTGASTMMDVIIGLKYTVKEDNVERRITVIKARGSDHSRKIHKYEITERGIEIYG
ncbi:ATPase domain-containing protein [Thermococcus sp.]|uniref:ATPase domain-containing protein n=1 Tax=Thermococcus sp. TaxID=35749 RepID=UPI00262C2349|nr:ATPase domain-containing protein [Thermococcus sp.]